MIGPPGGMSRPGETKRSKEEKINESTMDEKEDDVDESLGGPTENLLQPGSKISMDDFQL